MDFSSIMTIVNGVAVGVGVPGILYIVKRIHRISELSEKHERILFGEENKEMWEGLVTICLANRKYSINDRKAFISLISILNKNGVVVIDDEFKDAIEPLKKYE